MPKGSRKVITEESKKPKRKEVIEIIVASIIAIGFFYVICVGFTIAIKMTL
jgi:preprotein translocase subunit Sss1